MAEYTVVPLTQPVPWTTTRRIPPGIVAAIEGEVAAINGHRPAVWVDVVPYLYLAVGLDYPVVEALSHAMRAWGGQHSIHERNGASVGETLASHPEPALATDSYTLILRIILPQHRYCVEVRSHWQVIHDELSVMYPLIFDNCQIFLVPEDGQHGAPSDLNHKRYHRLLDFIYRTLPSEAAVTQWIATEYAQSQDEE